ncbi:LysR family transcriptional regulator [Roseibium sediminicola]|uniref:LysR family transcriptional regulator n=1 Tax=Roseibium sediminicola TaxID=2933272 RepID=A0ABT0GZE0_9HYPH|nr:LysR family transcriptional regulator [Roseibium sp. CAU 1639]MCK7614203.1 LysR family transcriptional regulator [Roseibium sp. CAU 1639]
MNIDEFDWDSVRVFLAVAEHQSLSRAAETLALSQPTVGRHVARLEDQLDVQLFDRRQTGYELTGAGRRLVKVARSMARGAADFGRAVDLEKADSPEQVCRITLGEWGQHFLTLRATEITRGLDNIRIEFFADDAFWDLSRNSADIAIGNRPPKHPHLIAQKLGNVSFHVYAAPAYLETHPDAKNPACWQNQVWAGYCGSRARLKSSQLLNELLKGKPCRYAVNSSLALFNILKAGDAMGILPDWVAEAEGLKRLTDAPLAVNEAWMSFHERLRLHPGLVAVKDRIVGLYRQRYETAQAQARPKVSPV